MKKILLQLIKSIKNERYVIIKLQENFPKNFKKGSDLDILCEDNKKLFHKLRPIINDFLLSNNNHEIKILELSQNHKQIDFYIKKILLFKLDIFDKYENSSKLKNKILNNRILKKFNNISKSTTIKVPKYDDDTFIRYTEFLKSGKKKNQHKKFFLKFIKDQKLKNTFKVYLNRSKNDFEVLLDLVKKYKSQINYYKYKLDKHSLNEIAVLIKKKFIEK